MKRTVIAVLLFLGLVPSIYAQTQTSTQYPVLGSVVRTTDSQVMYRSQFWSAGYCEAKGTRLPTAREIAMALNPNGFSDVPKEGFRPINKDDGQVDFYYTPSTYVPPEEGEGHLWSSTLAPMSGEERYYYVFSEISGHFSVDGENHHYSHTGTRCLGPVNPRTEISLFRAKAAQCIRKTDGFTFSMSFPEVKYEPGFLPFLPFVELGPVCFAVGTDSNPVLKKTKAPYLVHFVNGPRYGFEVLYLEQEGFPSSAYFEVLHFSNYVARPADNVPISRGGAINQKYNGLGVNPSDMECLLYSEPLAVCDE